MTRYTCGDRNELVRAKTSRLGYAIDLFEAYATGLKKVGRVLPGERWIAVSNYFKILMLAASTPQSCKLSPPLQADTTSKKASAATSDASLRWLLLPFMPPVPELLGLRLTLHEVL
jgi:hypothetical protein